MEELVTGLLSMWKGPERPPCEVAKVKVKLHWRPENTGDIRAIGHLPQRAAGGDWSLARPTQEAVCTATVELEDRGCSCLWEPVDCITSSSCQTWATITCFHMCVCVCGRLVYV